METFLAVVLIGLTILFMMFFCWLAFLVRPGARLLSSL